MLEHLKELTRDNSNFLHFRWDNPLHSDKPTESQSRTWPSSEDFFHPLNPMYSFFFQRVEQLDFFKIVLLRDGAISLLDFFLRFPTPKGCKTQVLVPADLMFLVPDAWKPQLLAYRMNDPKSFKLTKRLLFYGLISDTCLSWPRFQNVMPEWLKQFPRDASVSAFFAVRNEPIDHLWVDRKTAFEFMSRFQPAFNNLPELLNAQELKGMLSKADVTFINLDLWRSGTGLCTIDNLAFGQEVQVFPRASYHGFKGKKVAEWPMSFRHNLEIYTPECEHNDFNGFMIMKRIATNSTASLPHPIVPKVYDLLAERLSLS